MDAKDTKIIEQLKMLHQNKTIVQVDSLKNVLIHNEQLIMNITRRMEVQLAKFTQHDDMNEYLLILTIMNNLIRDAKNVINYLTYTKDNIIMTRLLPTEKIITALKSAAMQLTEGLHFHFNFKIKIKNWRTIQKHLRSTSITNRT